MFDRIPLEIVEKIMLYLSIVDILSVFTAFNKNYNILPEYFWKTLCSREDFCQAYEKQHWYDSFQCGVNKKLGYYVHLTDCLSGTLQHVYLRSIVVSVVGKDSKSVYKVFFLNDSNEFLLVQTIVDAAVKFKGEFIFTRNSSGVSILKYNKITNKYEFLKSLPESFQCVIGINKKYCGTYNSELKVFNIYSMENQDLLLIHLPKDIKFVIQKVLHQDNVVISALTFHDGYKIKLYNIESKSWTLDLTCFSSTGITNDPNIWVGSNFVGCCDVFYRLRGIYFGPFKVWNKTGVKLLQADIEPSTKHYLRCFFKEENIILTTSDKSVTVFDNQGKSVSIFSFKNCISDIKISTGHLIFFLKEEHEFVEVYDWILGSHLYSIELHGKYSKSFYSDFIYCPVNEECNHLEVIKFF